ncbi:MAG: hypothetical protein N3G21_07800 [Candidatus Hydrogenedentes bacterium]|nr:hypothetical protein [Candidatus Hydrogenedentota bacterium]
MNALVQFKSKIYGTGLPTQAERAQANKRIQSMYQAKRMGIFKDYIRRVYGEKMVKNLHFKGDKLSKSSVSKSEQTTSRQTSNVDGSNTGASNEISADTFLQLLVMQMQYQDPLEPIQNTDMLAQLAQFSNLEQAVGINSKMDYLLVGMGNLTSSLQALYVSCAHQLIGKYVEGSSIDGESIKGRVESVVMENGNVMVLVGGIKVPLANIQMVSDVTNNFDNGERK